MPIANSVGMDGPLLATLAGSAVAGLSGSPHCALMCGPLACAGLPAEKGARLKSATAWHAARVGAYASVGAALGGIGGGITALLSKPVQQAVPWLMAAGLVATAFDVGRWLKPLPGVGAIAKALTARAQRVSPTLRAGLLGAATPFLPCGLLYGVFLAVAASGSALAGAGLMAAFAVGGTGALAATQLPGMAVHRLPPWVRRGVLVAAAALLIWRAAGVEADAPPHCH